jgi:hypothetical protein
MRETPFLKGPTSQYHNLGAMFCETLRVPQWTLGGHSNHIQSRHFTSQIHMLVV